MPLRGIVGSDLLAHRDDWRLIDNPFAEGDRIVAVSAIVPDVALFHAPAADRHGNVFLGRERDGLLLAHASRATLVTVERIVEGNLLEDEARAGSVLPALYVTQVAHVPRGAWPAGLAGHYGADAAMMSRYAQAARSDAGFAAALDELHAARSAA
jgi:glutaconate CoA-transferase subunit A